MRFNWFVSAALLFTTLTASQTGRQANNFVAGEAPRQIGYTEILLSMAQDVFYGLESQQVENSSEESIKLQAVPAVVVSRMRNGSRAANIRSSREFW